MSPIPTISVAFAPTVTPSIPVNSDLAGQSAPMMSQKLVRTGGILFAVVAIVSVAGYLHHGRKKTSNVRKNGPWFGKFLSKRYHTSSTAPAEARADHQACTEIRPRQTSIVYSGPFLDPARSYPSTPSTPTSHVEDEGSEIPGSESKSLSVYSSLDDDDRNRDNDDGAKNAQTNVGEDAKLRVPKVPLCYIGSSTNVCFRSEIKGATDRLGGVFRDHSSEVSSSDDIFQTSSCSEIDLGCIPYDGIASESEISFNCSPHEEVFRTPWRTYDDGSDYQMDFVYSPYDGCLTDTKLPYYRHRTDSGQFTHALRDTLKATSPSSPDDSYEITSESETDSPRTPYDGATADSRPDEVILKMPSRSFPTSRRFGIVDMTDLTQALKETIPEEGHDLVCPIAYRSELRDLADFDDTNVEMDSVTSCKQVDRPEPLNSKPMSTSCDAVHDSQTKLQQNRRDLDAFRSLCDCWHLLETMLEEFRYLDTDGIPRSLSMDGSCDEENVSRLTPAWPIVSSSQVSVEQISSVSDNGSIYPVTPPLRFSKSRSRSFGPGRAGMTLSIALGPVEETQGVLPPCTYSPRWLPSKANIQTDRPDRPLRMVCGSQQMSTICPPGVRADRMESLGNQLNETASPRWLPFNSYVRKYGPRHEHPLQVIRVPSRRPTSPVRQLYRHHALFRQ